MAMKSSYCCVATIFGVAVGVGVLVGVNVMVGVDVGGGTVDVGGGGVFVRAIATAGAHPLIRNAKRATTRKPISFILFITYSPLV
jgi:hypothetical protein